MIKIKICGITRSEDARTAENAGADFMGLVFAPSLRRVNALRALEIMRSVPDFKNWVAVFVNEDRKRVVETAQDLRISYLQLHGRENPEDCEYFTRQGFQVIKAHRIQDAESFASVSGYDTPFILFDSFSLEREGGTGRMFEWALLKGRTFMPKVFLSGGLRPQLLSAAFSNFLPYAVDVSSGVELSPGIKSAKKIRAFIDAVKKAETRLRGAGRHA